ncbi:MAG: MFS transporter, partial [Acidimicrobiales bacterium]
MAVAVNLRPAITAVGPVLTGIERTTGLSAASAGLLTTLPVLAFGLCSPLAPAIARRYGIEATVAGSLVVLVAGLAVRAAPSVALLFLGTAAAGVAIAAGNVLVPAVIKRDFPLRARVATGTYSVALSAGAALAAGVSVPLTHSIGGGWRLGIAFWAAPAMVALVLWVAATSGSHHAISPMHAPARLWRDPLAWQVTVFMGLQSLGFYALVAWIPTIFQQHGVSASTAGWLLSLSGFASLPAAFAAPLLATGP